MYHIFNQFLQVVIYVHFAELLLYLGLLFVFIIFVKWLGNLPSKERFESLKTEMLQLKRKEEQLLIDYKQRKKKARLLDKLSTDKSELKAVRSKIRDLQPEYQRHANKYCPDTIEKNNINAARVEAAAQVANKGIRCAQIIQAVSKIIK